MNAITPGKITTSGVSSLNAAAALYTCDIHLAKINPNGDARRIGQWVAVVFAVVSLAMVPLYQHSQSIIATLQQLNGLYSMPVLAAFIVAVAFTRIDPRAARTGLVFGAVLYAVFTFVWSPLHYIHLMFITLVATIALTWGMSRLLDRSSGRLAGGAKA